MGQLSPHTTTREPVCHIDRGYALWNTCTTAREKPEYHSERSHMLQLRPDAAKDKEINIKKINRDIVP